jgi:hypothetical protein
MSPSTYYSLIAGLGGAVIHYKTLRISNLRKMPDMSEAAGGFWSILGIFEKTYHPTYDKLG